MTPCPSCAAPVSSDARVGDVAQCAACGAVFELPPASEVSAPAPPVSPMPKEWLLGSPPAGVFVRQHPSGLELVLPWRKNLNAGGSAVHLLIAGAPLYFWYMSGTNLLLTLAFSLPLLYNWLYNMVNSTHVFIAAGGVEVAHGPLPSLNQGVRLNAQQARRVMVEHQIKRTSKGGRWTVWHLQAPQAGTTLLKEWNYEAPLEYVRHAIEVVHPPVERLQALTR